MSTEAIESPTFLRLKGPIEPVPPTHPDVVSWEERMRTPLTDRAELDIELWQKHGGDKSIRMHRTRHGAYVNWPTFGDEL